MLRGSVRRLSRAELAAEVARAPSFKEDWVPEAELERICAGYEAITGVRVATRKKRAFVAAAYRTLGSQFLPAVKHRFSETGTETNLLVDLRGRRAAYATSVGTELHSAPRAADRQERAAPERAPLSLDSREAHTAEATSRGAACGCAVSDLRPGLIYCAAHRPPFDPISRRRYDRCPSNPEAAGLFSVAELAPTGTSPTVQAFGR
jgi:hypothetical protein